MKDDDGQIRRAADSGEPGAKLSALSASTAAQGNDSGSRLASQADRPPALRGAVLPGRDRNIRKKAMRLFWEHPHLALGDWRATYRYVAVTDRLIPNALAALRERGLFKPDGSAYDANNVLKGYMAAALSHEERLGLTASARAALGVDITRLRKLARDDDGNGDGADVAELEGRLLRQLQGDGDGD